MAASSASSRRDSRMPLLSSSTFLLKVAVEVFSRSRLVGRGGVRDLALAGLGSGECSPLRSSGSGGSSKSGPGFSRSAASRSSSSASSRSHSGRRSSNSPGTSCRTWSLHVHDVMQTVACRSSLVHSCGDALRSCCGPQRRSRPPALTSHTILSGHDRLSSVLLVWVANTRAGPNHMPLALPMPGRLFFPFPRRR